MLVSIAVLSLAPDNELAEENHWNEKTHLREMATRGWVSQVDMWVPATELVPAEKDFPGLVFFSGDLVVGPVVVETQEKNNHREEKVLGESCSTNPKKDVTESPFDYAQQ